MENLSKEYWDNRYIQKTFSWDLGQVSPPLMEYINQLTDKNISILIPGCGNTYEAEYLLQKGFTNITVIDISPTLVESLKQKFKNNSSIKIICNDFFNLNGSFDLMLEQTFFCAINPVLREEYCKKTQSLLANGGKLVGLLFDVEFENEGPPFGGKKSDYSILFSKYFKIKTLDKCYNSFIKRKDNELFIIATRKV